MKFQNKVAMITGAAVGIGRATAIEMAKEGAKLALLDVNPETLDALKKELEVYPVEVVTYICDISDLDRVNEVAADAIQKLGKIDILVNNAALWRDRASFVDSDVNLWKKYFDINVLGTVYVTKAVLPGMLEREWGRIINVASVAGVYGNAKMSCYSAT